MMLSIPEVVSTAVREDWLVLMIDSVAKGSLLIILALLLVRALRGRSAATRHSIWAIAIGAQLALPLLALSLPGLAIPLPRLGSPASAEVLVDGIGEARSGNDGTPFAINAPALQAERLNAEDGNPPGNVSTAGEHLETRSPVATTETGPATLSSTVPARAPISWGAILLAVWLAGGIVVLLRLVAGTIRVSRMARTAERVTDPHWLALAHRTAVEIRLSRPFHLMKGGRLDVPVTFGISSPVVLLPTGADEWPEAKRRAVLLHELAHVERGDSSMLLLSQMALAVFWFNPLVWMALEGVRAEGERACDDFVLRAGTKASAYVDDLLIMVRSLRRETGPAFATLAMARRSEFEGRMLAILDANLDRRVPGRPHRWLMIAAALCVILPLAAMRPVPSSPADDIPPRSESDKPGATDDLAEADMPAIPHVDARPDGAEQDTLRFGRSMSKLRRMVEEQVDAGMISESVSERTASDMTVRAEILDEAQQTIENALDIDAGVSLHLGTEIESGNGTGIGSGFGRGSGNGRRQGVANAEVVTALISALNDADAEVRRVTISALGDIGDPRAIEALSQALRSDPDAEVRKMAAWALGEIEEAAAVPALAEASRSDESMEVRRMAVWAMGQIEDPSAVPAIGAALQSTSDAETRKMAVWALGQIESPTSVGIVTPLLSDDDAEVRKQAAWALGQIESPNAVQALGASVRDADPEVRAMAVWALGQIEAEAGAPFLATALADERADVRRNAARALGELDLGAAPPALINALKDSDVQVRRMAARALGEIEDPAAVPALSAAMRDSDSETRMASLRALSEIRDPAALEVIIAALKDEDPEIRRLAARALGQR
ncbi:MAG: HEAT repeat domain-containing protein [Gemmatimonadaceae bacterium]